MENNNLTPSNLKTCAICGTLKPLSGFYQKGENRFDPLCKECRKTHERLKYKIEKKRSELNEKSPDSDNRTTATQTTSADQSIVSAQSVVAPNNSNSEPIFKEYRYPDGRVLRLTRSEFEEVAEVFKMLINQNRKNKGKPLLMG